MSDIDGSGVAADAFVFFGATGDLAHKMIFPALYQMVKRDTLGVPVIGVASSGWDLPQLRDRARDSIAGTSGGIDDQDALDRLLSLWGTSTAITATRARLRSSGRHWTARSIPRITSPFHHPCSRR